MEKKNNKYSRIVKKFIRENASKEKAKYDEGLITSSYKIKGISTLAIDKFAKGFAKEKVNIFDLPLTCHEEILIAGMVIGYSKKSPEEKVSELEYILPYIDNWATCDMIVPRLKGMESQKEFFVNLLHDTRPFYVRFGIVWLMKFELKKDIRGVVNLINNNVNSTNYFVEMALSWCYCEALIYDYEYIVEFVQQLNRCVIRNRTLQKACDSYRVSDERKKEIRALRSKLLGIEI